jgi:diguanylate cyclase (GGDEF)-like protein
MSGERRALDIREERELAGRLAGLLFVAAGLSAAALLVLPGGHTAHGAVVLAVGVGCLAWGITCLGAIDFSRVGQIVWDLPAALALAATATTVAATGGADSPARFYLFFVLVYAAYFYEPGRVAAVVFGCVTVAALPLLYDPAALEGQYVGELLVLGTAYSLLGFLIVRGKQSLLRLREQARALSLRDPLTELPNRRALLEWLRERTDGAAGRRLGLLLVDLDGFKDVNTVHGFPVGDRVLVETARTLEACVRTDDLVARLGGDEFAVLATDADPEGMRRLALGVLNAVRGMEERLDLSEVTLTGSVGWVLYPQDADTIDDLIAAADFCLRGAKQTGKDRALAAVDWQPDLTEAV